MRSSRWMLFAAVLLSVGGAQAAAWAEAPASASEAGAKPAVDLPWFGGFSGGVGYAIISHPEITAGGAVVPVITLHGGYTFGDRLNLGLEFTGMQTNVGRDTKEEPFQLGYSPQVIWQPRFCPPPCEPQPHGADVSATSLVFSTLGARVEYAPLRRDGLFVSGLAGMAFMVGLKEQAGFGFAGRVGYRARFGSLTLSLEGGMAGQIYGDATMFMPFAAAVFRPYFDRFAKPYPPGYWDRRGNKPGQ